MVESVFVATSLLVPVLFAVVCIYWRNLSARQTAEKVSQTGPTFISAFHALDVSLDSPKFRGMAALLPGRTSNSNIERGTLDTDQETQSLQPHTELSRAGRR